MPTSCPCQMVSPENIRESNIIWRTSYIQKYVCTFISEHNEKGDREFEEEWRVYGKAWRKEREGRNIIIISKEYGMKMFFLS